MWPVGARSVRTKPHKEAVGLDRAVMDRTASDPGSWGTCRYCGVAVPADAVRCRECGADGPVRAGELPRVPRKLRIRLRLLRFVRTAIIVGVVVALLYAILPGILQGPLVLSEDPLTTSGMHLLGPGNFTVIAGEITGGDYVVGNFTSVAPVGLNIDLSVYNSSAWSAFQNHSAAAPVWSLPSTDAGRIVYSPPVTDTYYFVFTNPYPPSTDLAINVYIVTQYEPNVSGGGFG